MNKCKDIILLGDLNIDMLSEENEIKNNLIDVFDLSNLITDPTCFMKLGGTLIDPLIVKNGKRFHKPINVFCGFSGHHNLVCCITKQHIPRQKPWKKTYISLKSFNETDFVLDVSQIPFHISSIFDDQYWARKWLFTEILNELAPLKTRSVKENHLPYMHSYLRTNMYKRNMLKNAHKSDRQNNSKLNKYKEQRNKSTS